MAKVFLEISGGVVQGVFSDIPDLEVVKLDWDAGDSPGDELRVGRFYVDPTAAVSPVVNARATLADGSP
jgi:hypothetical protein